MYKKTNMVTTIKVRRLEWAGHVVRVADYRTVKKAFLGKPGGKRGVGRPNLRWINSVENDLKSVGVKRWRNKTEDRSSWAVILKEAPVKLKDLMLMKKKNTLGLCW
jgi:hypothetical protein